MGKLGPQENSTRRRARSANLCTEYGIRRTRSAGKVGPWRSRPAGEVGPREVGPMPCKLLDQLGDTFPSQENMYCAKMSTFSLTRSRGEYLRVVGILEMVE